MKRGRYAMVVPADGLSWSSGWIVMVDVNRSQAYEAGTDIAVLTSDGRFRAYDVGGASVLLLFKRMTHGPTPALVAAVENSEITPEYGELGSWRGPNTLK